MRSRSRRRRRKRRRKRRRRRRRRGSENRTLPLRRKLFKPHASTAKGEPNMSSRLLTREKVPMPLVDQGEKVPMPDNQPFPQFKTRSGFSG